MRSRRAVLSTVFLALLLLWTFVPLGGAQPAAGTLTVNADYELFGTTHLLGGGHITWTLTGGSAQSLRNKILGLFDDYTQVPRGFFNAGSPGTATQGTQSGVLTAAEGGSYTTAVDDFLENNSAGTQVGYYLLRKASIFDPDPSGGFQRSTSGLVGQGANSTENVQIEFITEGASTVQSVMLSLPTEAYVRALEDVFTFQADQTPSLTPGSGYPGAWPLYEETNASRPGWHIVRYGPYASLWAGNYGSCTNGNQSSCVYYPAMNLSVATYVDPTLSQKVPWVDLRFASSAWIAFNYTGQVTDAATRLSVQVAPGPSFSNWTTLSGGVLSSAQNTPADAWQPVSVNASAFLGQRVMVRLNFSSDGAAPSRGFFVKDFGIHAPSTYGGVVVESDAHYLIGTLSFSNFQTPSGGIQLVRTPGGEILFYGSQWQDPLPPDTAQFSSFDATENPQILFGVMIVACYFIARLQDSAYDTYRDAHPTVYRPAVHKAKWLHRLGTVAILVLILFYFVPTAFYAVGLKFYLNGPAYWFLALFLALVLGLGTRAYYNQKLEETPPPSVAAPGEAEAEEGESPEAAPASDAPRKAVSHCTQCLKPVLEGERTYACSCGALYHLSCASGLMRCSTCRKPIAIEAVKPSRSVSMRCDSCGEVQTIPEDTDPRTVACTSCGGILRPLDAGKRYLLVASNPAIAFRWLSDLARGGKPALIITSSSAERLRLEFGLKDVQFLQVGKGPDAIDAKKLDPAGLKSILPLARAGKGGVLLYDGVDTIVAESSLGDLIRFLRKANDMAFVHGVTVIARLAPGALVEEEVARLGKEFDELLDLTARL